MPLPLAPLLPIALRLGAVAAVGYAARRALARRTHIGRTDQRAEDALDDLDEGLATHAPRDQAGQRNAALRIRRTVRFRGVTYEIDTGALARFRIRKLE